MPVSAASDALSAVTGIYVMIGMELLPLFIVVRGQSKAGYMRNPPYSPIKTFKSVAITSNQYYLRFFLNGKKAAQPSVP